jgi:hypothetical protein
MRSPSIEARSASIPVETDLQLRTILQLKTSCNWKSARLSLLLANGHVPTSNCDFQLPTGNDLTADRDLISLATSSHSSEVLQAHLQNKKWRDGKICNDRELVFKLQRKFLNRIVTPPKYSLWKTCEYCVE